MWHIQWIALCTLTRKEITRILRIWTQTLLPSIITTTLYFLIFGTFIGAKIGKLNSFNYIEFIVPGLIMMSVITNAYANVSSSVFSCKFQNNIDELLVSPMRPSIILLGFLLGGIFRGISVGLMVTGISLIFTDLQIHNLSLVLVTITLTSTIFCLTGFLNALYAKKFDDIAIIPTFILTPLIYLGGVFYSIHSLPDFWKSLSLFNPILYLVNIFRYGFLGISDIHINQALPCAIIILILLWCISHTLLKKGIGVRT